MSDAKHYLDQAAHFLTDYLQGDIYFHIDCPSQNLNRCRIQLKLVQGMEQVWEDRKDIISKYQ